MFRPSAAFAFSHPAHAVALGFGAGLAPFAPGTFGTALGWAISWGLGGVQPGFSLIFILLLFFIGIWACGVTGRHIGVEDHGAMVWDEVVAFLLVLAFLPAELPWQAAAFVAFRVFDIAKPPPIRFLEQRYGGGFGVMFDDLVAAGYTLLLLGVLKRVFF